MDFYEKYTTKEKVDAEKLEGKEEIEQRKVVISNDTFAKCEVLKELCYHIRRIK